MLQNYTKDLHDLYNQDGVITLLESDVLEFEVKWAYEHKASEAKEFQLSYFRP